MTPESKAELEKLRRRARSDEELRWALFDAWTDGWLAGIEDHHRAPSELAVNPFSIRSLEESS